MIGQDINQVLSSFVPKRAITADNSERLGNLKPLNFFRSLPGSERPDLSNPLNLFNKVCYVYPNEASNYGLPTDGVLIGLSWSSYTDTNLTSIGTLLLIGSNNNLYYMKVASAVNGGNGTWKRVATA